MLYSFPTRFGVSGIGNTAWNQVQGLVSLGVRVTLACGSCERPVRGIHRVVETMKLGRIKLPYRLLGRDRAAAFHDAAVAKLLGGADRPEETLVHCWPSGSLETLRVAKKLGIKTVLERPNTHTGFAYEAVAREHEKLGVPLTRSHTHVYNGQRLAREIAEYELADRLACPSDFVVKTFLDRGIDEKRIARHQYGFDPASFSTAGDKSCGGEDRPIAALFAGRCEPRKGLHLALEAWHRAGPPANGRFVIVGDFIRGYRKYLGRLLDHPSVQHLGFVKDVPSIMRRSNMLILPSIEEGSALVTYEARACGCVLLVSDATGARCTHGVDGLIHAAGDVEALTEHLALLVSDRARLAQLRRASLAGVQELTWKHAAKIMLGIYRDLIDFDAPESLPASPLRVSQ